VANCAPEELPERLRRFSAKPLVFFSRKESAMNHPMAHEFDAKAPVTLTGTVTQMDWSDPHVVLHVDAKENGGDVKHWRVEMGTLDEMEHHGWTETTLKRGDRITVQGNRAKAESHFASARMIETAGGKQLSATSVCHPS
jgi:hypothetical protein